MDYEGCDKDDDEICCKELPDLSRTCYGLLNSHTILLFCHITTIALSLSYIHFNALRGGILLVINL